jgi:hypothetical protein
MQVFESEAQLFVSEGENVTVASAVNPQTGEVVEAPLTLEGVRSGRSLSRRGNGSDASGLPERFVDGPATTRVAYGQGYTERNRGLASCPVRCSHGAGWSHGDAARRRHPGRAPSDWTSASRLSTT